MRVVLSLQIRILFGKRITVGAGFKDSTCIRCMHIVVYCSSFVFSATSPFTCPIARHRREKNIDGLRGTLWWDACELHALARIFEKKSPLMQNNRGIVVWSTHTWRVERSVSSWSLSSCFVVCPTKMHPFIRFGVWYGGVSVNPSGQSHPRPPTGSSVVEAAVP